MDKAIRAAIQLKKRVEPAVLASYHLHRARFLVNLGNSVLPRS